MSIISRVFDHYQWVKGDWASTDWRPEAEGSDNPKATGNRNILSHDSYKGCLGACAMGVIHIDNDRDYYAINNYSSVRRKLQEGEKVSNNEYLGLFHSYLYAALDVACNTIWHMYAAGERESGNPAFLEINENGHYVLTINSDNQLPTVYGIVDWNDYATTSEAEVRKFFEFLSDHREYNQIRQLIMLPDYKLVTYAKGYIDSLPLEFLELDIGGYELRHYHRLKEANVI